jgi:hypothetical protein
MEDRNDQNVIWLHTIIDTKGKAGHHCFADILLNDRIEVRLGGDSPKKFVHSVGERRSKSALSLLVPIAGIVKFPARGTTKHNR